MSKTVKVLLLVLGGVFLLLGGLVAGGYLWFQKHQAELFAEGKAAADAGTAFGRGRGSPACVAEALRQNGACSSILCEVRSKLFLAGCLRASQRPAGFCDGVPPADGIMDSVRFRLARCQAEGRGSDQACGRLMEELQKYCAGR